MSDINSPLVIEDIRLEVNDLDLINATAFIREKGQDDKELVHLHPETVKALKLYLKTNKIADGALFKSLRNKKSYRITTLDHKTRFKGCFGASGDRENNAWLQTLLYYNPA